MTPERYQKLRRILDLRQPDLTLLTDQIHKPRNIAALVRTSDAVGLHELNMVWHKENHRPYSGTAMGSDRWVDVVRHESMSDAIDKLHEQDYQVYAAHLSSEAVDYRSVDYTQPCAILMGNEKKGVSELAANKMRSLIELKYNTIGDAVAEFGSPLAIRETFIGFQKHLYE